LQIEGCHMVSVEDPPRSLISVFHTGATTFLPNSISFILVRLSGPRSRPTAMQKMWYSRESNLGPLGLQPGTLTTRSERRPSSQICIHSSKYKNTKNQHIHPAMWNVAHRLPVYACTITDHCIALLQLLHKWQHQSMKLWIQVVHLSFWWKEHLRDVKESNYHEQHNRPSELMGMPRIKLDRKIITNKT
jgi:hypothetical protein